MASGSWWYCMKHSTVEGDDGCSNSQRMGPYATQVEASHALDIAAERTEAWDNDPAWNDDADKRRER
ncbi:MAG: hypothetical protein M3Q27_10045 [Actinomycetota bacterium]|nr:hypothetical protein [Actinomycetota bacterium]